MSTAEARTRCARARGDVGGWQPGGMEGPRAGDIYSWVEGKAGESAEIWTLDWSEAGGRGRKVPSAEPAPEV